MLCFGGRALVQGAAQLDHSNFPYPERPLCTHAPLVPLVLAIIVACGRLFVEVPLPVRLAQEQCEVLGRAGPC